MNEPKPLSTPFLVSRKYLVVGHDCKILQSVEPPQPRFTFLLFENVGTNSADVFHLVPTELQNVSSPAQTGQVLDAKCTRITHSLLDFIDCHSEEHPNVSHLLHLVQTLLTLSQIGVSF